MELIWSVVQDYWVLFAVGILLLLVVRLIAKALFKVMFVAVLIGFVAIFVFGKTPGEVIDTGKQALGFTQETLVDTLKPLLLSEIENADLTFNPDGSYEIKTKSARIVGKQGDPKATVFFGEQSFQVNIAELGELVQKTIESRQAP